MAKSKFIARIPVLLGIEGAFLMIFGFATGADFLNIVSVFFSTRSPLSVKEFYVLLGLLRIMFGSIGIERNPKVRKLITQGAKRATMMVVGILSVSFSAAAFVFSMIGIVRGEPVSSVSGIVIEFIAAFTLSLLYTIFAVKQPRR